MSKDFVGIATEDGKISWIHGHAAKLMEYLKKHPGQFIVFEAKPAYKKKGDPKSAAQCGYFFAVLEPEIHKQLVADGHTVTIRFGTIEKTVEIPIEAAHEAITALCGNVGDNGSHLRLSDCGLPECVKWLDNVMDLAAELGMDVEKLRAVRPKG